MHKILTLVLLLAGSTLSFGQNVSIKGKVTGPDDFPLESATIYLTSVKDSTVVDYTISNKNGNWELKVRKIEQPVYLKISFMGFSDYKKQLESVTADIDLGTLKMEDKPTELDEIVIESEIPPIRIKSDTLEFNASSFKVRPDANVEALLKQLPGVEVDAEGKITVNGKEVNQILVNGKPFFDKDGKIALQNLPAEIIDKVQVTDTKTKTEELSGQKASGNEASINLTIQEDKNKGQFGKFMGGYGTDERYESSALFNTFKGKRKISVLASSNNINSTGFSMDEIFDNMGGGRNMSFYTSSNGGFGINGMRFGGGQGITQSNMVGLNYSDEWFKGFDNTLSYFYTSADSKNENRTKQQNFLPETEDPDNSGTFINNNFTTESSSETDSYQYAHNFNTEFEWKIDSTSALQFSPKFVTADSRVRNNSRQFSVDENNELLNESDAYTFNENKNTSFSNNMYYNKAFKRKGRSLGVYFNNENRKDDGTFLNRSTTIFYDDANNDGIVEETADVRDQVRFNRQTSDEYDTGFHYYEPVLDSLQLKLAVNYQMNKMVEDRVGYDYNAATDEYSDLNELLTNYLTTSTGTVTPTVGISVQKNKFYLGADFGTDITQFNNYSFYLGESTRLNRQYLLPSANAYGNYRFTKSKSVYANYSYNVDFPSASQVLPVEDISNPLATFIGNPDLDPNKSHQVHLSFRDYDYATRSGYSIYAGGAAYDSQVVAYSLVDESAKSTTTYQNISGTYNTWVGANYNKSIKKEGNNYKFNVGVNTGFDRNKGFINGEQYDSKEISITPRAGFTWEYGELLTINPTYRYTYNRTDYTNYTIDRASNFVHALNLQTTSYWPKGFVFGNDFGYTYNSNIADGFKKDFFLWNTSLGYNFMNDQLLFKVKVYDVLDQNLSATRTISPTTITDSQNTVLKRYVMFSLTFKLNKFGDKKKEEGSRFWWF